MKKVHTQEPGQPDDDYRQIVSEINILNREREKANNELEKLFVMKIGILYLEISFINLHLYCKKKS